MGAILVAGAVNTLSFFMREPGSVVDGAHPAGYLLDGRASADLSSAYGQSLPIRGLAAGLYGATSYLLFSEGRQGVLVGEDGWLFTTEEFETAPDLEEAVERSVDHIANVRDHLAARGVDLLVAVVPAKATVHGERLGQHRYPARARQRYALVLQNLAARSIAAPDLLARLIETKAGQPMYLRTDTHWTVAGATESARAIAHAIGQRPDIPRVEVTLEPERPVEHEGDLVRFLALGPLQKAIGPAPERIVPMRSRLGPAEGTAALFGDSVISVALVGTSYSADPTWSFAAALSAELSADVLNVASQAVGAFRPMTDYLASPQFRERPPALVVWELPERYLDDGPEEERAGAGM
jgi:alginate O-acetyltransferase complex protein AlgJ